MRSLDIKPKSGIPMSDGTLHYAYFILEKKIINFRDVKYPHTGLAVEEALIKCITEWGIKDKVFTFTFDNASYNKTACDLLQQNGKSKMLFGGEHLFVRCCAHILNILMQDGMAIVHEVIELIRELIRHIISSPGHLQVFNDIARRVGLPPNSGLILDAPNRWSSTHDMIVEVVKYQPVFKRYAEEQQEASPTDPEWKNAATIGQFLKAFAKATKAFSADRTPTSHLFLKNVLCIHHALTNTEWQVNEVLKNLVRAMESKFNKYWDRNYNMALVVATILDPTKKWTI